MFGFFKKQKTMSSVNSEIDFIALMAIEESYIFSAKVMGNLPINHDENQLLSCLTTQADKSKNQQKTHSDYIKECKTGFEFTCFALEFVSRNFNSAQTKELGDYVFQRVSEKILDKYSEIYKPILEGSTKEIYTMLANMVDKSANEYVNLKFSPTEKYFEDTVGYIAARKVCQIIDSSEIERVMHHLYGNDFAKKTAEMLSVIQSKRVN